MRLPTYDTVWRIERRLYAVSDVVLPFQPTYSAIGIGFVAYVVWCSLLNLLGLPFAPGLPSVLYVVPPAVLTHFSQRPVADGKTPFGWLRSQVRYLTEPSGPDRSTVPYRCTARRGSRP